MQDNKKSRIPKKYALVALLLLISALAGIVYWAVEVRTPSTYVVCLQGFNHTDRWISEYRVNGQWGGNIAPKGEGDSYGGGGSFACGATVDGKAVTVKWEYSLPKTEDYDRGVTPETHQVTVPMPVAESNRSRYFQIHIFPDHHIELQLSDTSIPNRK